MVKNLSTPQASQKLELLDVEFYRNLFDIKVFAACLPFELADARYRSQFCTLLFYILSESAGKGRFDMLLMPITGNLRK